MNLPNGLHVLATDDEEQILKILKEYLDENLGHKIEVSHSPLVASEILGKKEFDLLITDYRMPKMNGGELVRTLRSIEGPNKEVPVIFLSAYLAEAIQASKLYTNVYYLTKPVILSNLYATINLALGAS